jgi:chemotaxis protein methyltransferase CheR
MSGTVDRASVTLFKELVARRLGLQFEESKQGELAEVLESRLEQTRQLATTYLSRLADFTEGREEVGVLARKLTVPETYFFRNMEQLCAFADVVVPERTRLRSGRRQLRILSAGCASGEEPFSLAMLVSERLPHPSTSVSIKAVDLNPSALEKAARARYSAWSLRETPPQALQRWFSPVGRDFSVDEAIRGLVSFEERNLVEANSDLWRPDSYDIVFCRNLLMYFTKENALALVGRISAALATDGYLFLGHAETLRGLSQDFHLRHTHGAFYYQRRSAPAEESRPAPSPEALIDVGQVPPALDEADTWIATIQRASDRIQALAERSARPPRELERPAGGKLAAAAGGLGSALELLKAERFGAALDLVRDLPPESADDPDVLLLRATLLTHEGRLQEAQRSCQDVLGRDELNAGAHYLLALCREGQSDLSGASEHDEIAAYLDARFAMPRLHLGLLARRAGDRERARRALSLALELLDGEEAGRLLLFGGGFSRDALAAMCRAELAACGGAR